MNKLRMLPWLVAGVLGIGACAGGGFPSKVDDYHHFAAIAKQPKGSYLRTLRSSVQSRVAAIQPESFAWQELKRFRSAFERFDAISQAEPLMAALKAAKMDAVVVRIRQALISARRDRPIAVDAALEAGAIKLGLIAAYLQLAPND